MKKLLLFAFLVLSGLVANAQVVFTSLQGNSPTLTKGAGNTVPYGFSMFVPAGGSFSGGVLDIGITQSINGFATASLVRVASADPTLALSAPLTTYAMNVNGSGDNALAVNSWPTFTGAASTGTTYYFYVIVNYGSSNNSGQPTAYQFYLPTGITQNAYSPGGNTVTNTNSKTFNFATGAPVFTYSSQVFTVNVPITSVSPNNTGGAPTSASGTLPAGLSISSTGIISGTPTAVSAATNYTITLTNANGSNSGTINIAVVPLPPSISYTSPQVYYVGSAITSLSPVNTGGTVVSYSVSPGLPAGLSLNTSTGVISGTPTASSSATDYTVTATNTGGTSTATINITVGAPPSITYATPQSYPTGTAITPLSPTNTGGPVNPANYTTSATFASPAGPYSVTVDASNNVFTVDNTNGYLYKYNSAGVQQFRITGFGTPTAVAVDGSGNIFVSAFVATGSFYYVYKLNSAGTLLATYSGFNQPYGLAVDASNNVYVADYGSGNIIKLASSTATGTIAITAANTYLSGFTTPYGVAFNATGDLFVSQQTLNNVIKVASGSTTKTTFYSTGLNGPRHLSFDAFGNLFIADYTNNAIKRVNGAGTLTLTVTSGVSSPRQVAFNSSGDMFEADYGTNTIKKFTSTNYTISATLPAGLSFDTSTGIISGTPTVITASTNYTITATNAYGSSSTIVNITITPPPPVISYVTPQTYTVNTAITALSPTNTGGAITGASSSPALPAGLTISATGVISGTPTVASAATAYTITATNAGGSGTFVLTITVILPAPVISYATPQVYNVGIAIPTLSPSSTGGAVASYSVSPGLPAGLSLNTSTGAITGTPTTAVTAANYTVTATNSGGSATFPINITVNGYLSGYAYRMPVTLNTTTAATTYSITTDQTNFPILLKITDPSLVYVSGSCTNKVQSPNGPIYDFAFTTSASASELNYQVESYDQAAGTLLVWVRVPSLTYATNNSLLFYFGNTTAASISNHTSTFYTNTWTGATAASKNYSGVWHFNEVPSTSSATLLDATSAGQNLKAYTSGTVSQNTSSVIGNGIQTTGSNVSATLTGYAALNTSLTMSSWVYFTTAPAGNQNLMVLIGAGSGDQMGFRGNANPALTNYGGTSLVASSTAASTGTWHYVVYTYNSTGTVNSMYVDGVLKNTNTATPQTGSPTNIFFGDYTNGSTETLTGSIDEARVIYTTLSADWIKFEYANQSSPATFGTVGTVTTDPTNVLTIPGGVIYTYNGSYTPNVTGVSTTPSFNGNESFVFASSAAISATNSVYGVTVNSGNTLTVNSGQTLNVACNVVNNGTITYGGTTSNLTFNGSAATQSYTAAATTNIASVGNLVVNNSAAGTVTINGGPVNVYNLLTLTKGSLSVATSGSLTLKSSATQTAAVDVITNSAYKITGYVNVERFLTGGGLAANRGYRLMSSPVNQTSATTASTNTFGLSYIRNHTYLNVTYLGAFTGGVGGTSSGFNGSSIGPSIYLYKETLPASNTNFLSGKHVGVGSINVSGSTTSTTVGTTATVTTLHATDPTVTIAPPIGNGFLFYFVGPSTRSSGSASAGAPTDATITANGYLNQGTFTVNLWYTPTGGVGKLSYTSTLGTPGFNMVGNPYASTLNLNTVLNDNAASISAIYVLGSKTGGTNQNYVTYVAGGTSSPTAQGYAVSGGGFIVVAKSSAATLTFNEAQKSPTQQLTGTGLIMSAPRAQTLTVDRMGGVASQSLAALPPRAAEQPITGLYMKMEKDSLVYDYTGIYFKNGYNAKFDENDGRYLNGPTETVSMSSLSADGVNTAVNLMPDYHNGSRIKLNVGAANSGLYQLKIEGIRNIDDIYDIYLIDKFKKDSLDIRRYGAYAFNLIKTDTTTFGANRFELSIRRKPLPPYLLTNFGGSKTTDGVKVVWTTQNESNYTGFTVERQNKATGQFEAIFDEQSNGNSDYNFVDHAPNSGNNNYRLKQNDIDGKISYSDVVTIFYDKNAAKGLFSVFPNPTVETINVSIPSAQPSTTYRMRLYNTAGNLMMQRTSNTGNWSENVSGLKPGAYLIEVIKSDGISLGKGKFVKN